jgi:SAM-dependent methyltransferase
MTQPHATGANFDRIARPYKFLEYLTLGPALQRCRTHYLPTLLDQKNALILGDGDGRFLAQLLAANPTLHADAVDTSRTMLDLLESRCAPYATRVQTHQTSALAFRPTQTYDLVVAHFFFDCLSQPGLEALIHRLTPHLEPGALWLLSDFRIPPSALRLPARLLVRALYLAFRLLTGLRTTQLPDHTTPLAAAGLHSIAHHRSLAGLLTTELWRRDVPATPRSSMT